jgi:carbamoyl-phosphate synthase small subunit
LRVGGIHLLGQALGAETFTLPFGHPGANQPVSNEITNKVAITTPNHGLAVRIGNLSAEQEPTHVNLNGGRLEGMQHRHLPVLGVQYHPEASAGPYDSSYRCEQFQKLVG